MSIPFSSESLTLGEVVSAAFDRARMVTTNRRETARLASSTVGRRLAQAHRLDLAAVLVLQATETRIRIRARRRAPATPTGTTARAA